MQGARKGDGLVLAGPIPGREPAAAAGDLAGVLAGFLEIRGRSEGAGPDPLVPRFDGHDDLLAAATITVSADGLTIGFDHGPTVRLTGVPALDGANEFAP